MKNHVITTRNGNSNLKRIKKITKTRCSLKKKGFHLKSGGSDLQFSSPKLGVLLKKKKDLHSDPGFILSIKCLNAY